MRRGIGILAMLALLGALGAGGFYFYQGHFPWERPPAAPAPAPPQAAPPAPPATSEPSELPAPTLTGEAPSAGAAPAQAIATLTGFEHTVKAKRASDLAWEDARTTMPLYDNDAVRTFDQATATIAFGPDDVVEVEENALVIIKPRDPKSEGSEISLALLSPDILKGLEARPAEERTKALADAAAKREVTIQPMAAPGKTAGKTRIAVRTLPDRTTTLATLSGAVKVVGPKGGAVVLKEKMVTKLGDAGLLLQPRGLPAAPDLVSPKDGESYAVARKSPVIALAWRPVERAGAYRLVVAGDPSFRKVVADERLTATSFSLGNLSPGSYYWRVRAQDGDGFDGPYSAARSLRVAATEQGPPELTIVYPPEMFISPAPTVELKGKTDREARLKINGQRVAVGPDGAFTFPLTLKEGVNLVTLEAVGPAGAAQYGRRLITYKGAKRSSTASVSGN